MWRKRWCIRYGRAIKQYRHELGKKTTPICIASRMRPVLNVFEKMERKNREKWGKREVPHGHAGCQEAASFPQALKWLKASLYFIDIALDVFEGCLQILENGRFGFRPLIFVAILLNLGLRLRALSRAVIGCWGGKISKNTEVAAKSHGNAKDFILLAHSADAG